jgi:16S rRNA (adenine1518-N6/adenine1519-N6)-dimethyltransferase
VSGHRARKRFGQNFLVDRSISRRIVDAVNPVPGDRVVEIGPGQGALTALLLERVPHISAIEIDRDLHALLAGRFPPDRLTLHEGDALEFDFGALSAALGGPLRVVGNLPYNISTPLLFHLAASADQCVDLHFMLQHEVVERMVAAPSGPEYGRLSVMLQSRYAMERLFGVPPESFRPIPKVQSAVVRLRPLGLAERMARGLPKDEARFARIVNAAFSMRRKTLRNALAGAIDVSVLERLGIDAGLRPENLSVADYARIADSASAPDAAGGEPVSSGDVR